MKLDLFRKLETIFNNLQSDSSKYQDNLLKQL